MDNFLMTAPLLIGFLHCLEPDHLVAVSALVKQDRFGIQVVRKGMSWGAGHSIPVLTIGIIYLFFNLSLERLAGIDLEFAVGMMLIVIGLWRLYHLVIKTSQEKTSVSSLSFLSVGIVHGLAGTVSVVMLLSSRQEGAHNQFYYLMLFCFGLMIGMGIMTSVMTKIMPLLSHLRWVQTVVPLLSLGYGCYIVLQHV